MPSNHLILFRPLLLLPSIFPSIRAFSSESVLHIRWPKYWSFSFNISSSNEYSGLISVRIDWFELLWFSSVESLSSVWCFVTAWTAACQAHLSITNSVDMNLSKLWPIVEDREAWHASVYGVTKYWTRQRMNNHKILTHDFYNLSFIRIYLCHLKPNTSHLTQTWTE